MRFPRLQCLCVVLILLSARLAFSSSAKVEYLTERGQQLARHGENQKAIDAYTAAIRLDPLFSLAYICRAQTFAELGDFPKALRDCDSFLKLDSSSPNAYVTRGFVLLRMGRDSESMSDLSAAIAKGATTTDLTGAKAMQHLLRVATPEGARAELSDLTEKVARAWTGSAKASALNSRAWLEATSPIRPVRDGGKAVADALESCRLKHWKDPRVIDTLAAAYAEKGDFEKALQSEEQAIANTSPKDANYLSIYRAHLAAYHRHQPWRANKLDRALVRFVITR